MKLKTATLLGLIGATSCIVLSIFCFFMKSSIYEMTPLFYTVSDIIKIIAEGTLVLFFFTLYKNQK